MAGSVTFKILIAYEGFERFAAIIRSQGLSEQGAAQLPSECNVQRGFGQSDCPDHLLSSDPAAKFLIPPFRPDSETKP